MPMSTGNEPGLGTNPYGVRCSRCARTQPPDRAPTVARWPYCIYCAAPLRRTRWVAHPPAGLGPAPRIRRLDAPYAGPPRYGLHHPAWGFPPVAKLRGRGGDFGTGATSGSDDPTHGGRDDLPRGGSDDLPRGGSGEMSAADERAMRRSGAALARRCSAAISLTLATALTCFAAAAAEGWRFALMLRGRTEVLPGRPVRASDAAVVVSSAGALVLAVCAVAASAIALLGLYRAAASRLDLRPVRSGGDIAARFFVPGWNLYGAGQIVVEVMQLVFRPVGGFGRTAPRWMRVLVRSGWVAWIFNGLATAVILVFSVFPALPWGLGHSNQFAANLVEAHAALNLIAGVTAVLFAVILAALRTEWFGSRSAHQSKWVVAQPVSSAANRQPPGRAPLPAQNMTSIRPWAAAGPEAASKVPGAKVPRAEVPGAESASAPKRSANKRAHTGKHRRR